MKNLITLLPLLLFLNCGPEAKMYKRTYIIENDTQVEIKLRFHLKYDGTLRTETILKPGSSYKGKELEFDQRFSENPNSLYPSQSFNSSDSLVIIFKNQKIKTDVVYDNEDGINYSDPIQRNLYRHGNFEDIGGGNFLFSINEQDFENATPCDGGCE